MNRTRNFAIMIGVFLLFAAVFAIFSLTDRQPQKAYDFSAGAHTGEVITLFDNLGKSSTALIFFDPEVEGSNTLLSKLIERKDSIDVVAVSVSGKTEQEQKALLPDGWDSLEKLCFEGSEAIEKYNVGNAPITYFIDKDGYVIDAFVGGIKDTTIDKTIKKMA